MGWREDNALHEWTNSGMDVYAMPCTPVCVFECVWAFFPPPSFVSLLFVRYFLSVGVCVWVGVGGWRQRVYVCTVSIEMCRSCCCLIHQHLSMLMFFLYTIWFCLYAAHKGCFFFFYFQLTTFCNKQYIKKSWPGSPPSQSATMRPFYLLHPSPSFLLLRSSMFGLRPFAWVRNVVWRKPNMFLQSVCVSCPTCCFIVALASYL